MLQHGDGRAIGVSVRKALLELGGVILAQQINPLTQKTPIGEAEHCLSNYRGPLQFWGAVHFEPTGRIGSWDGAPCAPSQLLARRRWRRACWPLLSSSRYLLAASLAAPSAAAAARFLRR